MTTFPSSVKAKCVKARYFQSAGGKVSIDSFKTINYFDSLKPNQCKVKAIVTICNNESGLEVTNQNTVYLLVFINTCCRGEGMGGGGVSKDRIIFL